MQTVERMSAAALRLRRVDGPPCHNEVTWVAGEIAGYAF